jgi:hypothetical protein
MTRQLPERIFPRDTAPTLGGLNMAGHLQRLKTTPRSRRHTPPLQQTHPLRLESQLLASFFLHVANNSRRRPPRLAHKHNPNPQTVVTVAVPIECLAHFT